MKHKESIHGGKNYHCDSCDYQTKESKHKLLIRKGKKYNSTKSLHFLHSITMLLPLYCDPCTIGGQSFLLSGGENSVFKNFCQIIIKKSIPDPPHNYRVFIWNLGILIAHYSGLFLVIWAKTYGIIFLCIGHFSTFRHNTNILDSSRKI